MDLLNIIAAWLGCITGIIGTVLSIRSIRPILRVKLSHGMVSRDIGKTQERRLAIDVVNLSSFPLHLSSITFVNNEPGKATSYLAFPFPQRTFLATDNGKVARELSPRRCAAFLSPPDLTLAEMQHVTDVRVRTDCGRSVLVGGKVLREFIHSLH